ncbi:MAG: DNA-3-methyladenine glycosylase I [Hyphomicrobiaceae bacterium]
MEKPRCMWPGLSDPAYMTYHDTEWGVPQGDDVRLFEKLVLEGFQSGLSWLTILRKRDHFRTAFDGFDAETIAGYGEREVARLMNDAGIVRNRLKIEGAILSAQAYLKLREEQTLADFIWGFARDVPRDTAHAAHGNIPAQTEVSVALSKALKKRGFRFVGPTTLYAFMQSVGIVNDHLTSCHRHGPCGKLQAKFLAARQKAGRARVAK